MAATRATSVAAIAGLNSSARETNSLRHRTSTRSRSSTLTQATNESSADRRRQRPLLSSDRRKLSGSSGEEEEEEEEEGESFLLPFMSNSFSNERDNGLNFGGGTTTPNPLAGESSNGKGPAHPETWHNGPEPKRWAEPEPVEGRGPGENSRKRGGSSSSLPARTYEVQSWGRPVVESTGGTTPLSGRTKPAPSLRAGGASKSPVSVTSPVYADGDLKGIARTGRPAPRGYERCATLRSGLVTSCTPPPPGDRLEFTLQCMLHQWDACRKRPELRSAACG